MNQEPKNTAASITLRCLAEPSTVNFGGKVMKWIDEAGYACATSLAQLDAARSVPQL